MRWSRRSFLSGLGLAPLSAARWPESGARVAETARENIYRELGVRPFINAAGTYTALSASLLSPEVTRAMAEAAKSYVSILELQQACGKRIASLVGAEGAVVTAGCAAALTLATAAVVSGGDEKAISRLPDTGGLRNEVILPKGHRFEYDHALRAVGVRIIEVSSARELRAAIHEKTALLFFLNHRANESPISRKELVSAGKAAGVPTLIDAAADLPPVENLTAFTRMGFDLVAFSGGKGLRGPQCSGLLLGRKDLIDAALLNGSPHPDSVARIAKVGKEEIVGLTKAVELYLAKDHEAEWQEWEERVSHILSRVSGIDGVHAERFVPEIANQVPHAAIGWDSARLRLTRDQFAQELREGEPRIEPRPSPSEEARLEIGVWMMEPGDHVIVAERCAEILKRSPA